MKKCCIKNIPTYRTKAMYCQDCGTKFEANTVKLNIKTLTNLSTKYSKSESGKGVCTYYKLTIKKAHKSENAIVLHVNYSKVTISTPSNYPYFLKVDLDLEESYQASRSIEALVKLGSTEAIIQYIHNSILIGNEITEEEYEQAKAKALTILDFAKSHA